MKIFDDKRSTNILDFGSGTKVIDLKDTNYGINRIDPRLNLIVLLPVKATS